MSSVTWFLKLVTVDTSLNTSVIFSMVMIKEKIQIILCPSTDECQSCRYNMTIKCTVTLRCSSVSVSVSIY
jgi:hypothetical protein